eukprot:TRINITY_DN30599_c0_g1_i2.p1 TRINITY_DN30599_c0_g1~~TRINITY_DN30599_c0_g1_i2.p1  ORF type:complete len:218 (-),score=68.69 TRINITY_DN30599_c0_g1_i2:449-1102(-)
MVLRFGLESGMSDLKVSTLFSVMKLAHFNSMERNLSDAQSMDEMQNLLLIHSVHHPPYSVGVFSPDDMKRIMDFATDTYYRHYRLYRYVYTEKQLLDLSLAKPAAQIAPVPTPLSEAKPFEDFESQDIEPTVPQPAQQEDPTSQDMEQQGREDVALLDDPKSELIQALVEKRLEMLKDELERELQAKQEEFSLLGQTVYQTPTRPPTRPGSRSGRHR